MGDCAKCARSAMSPFILPAALLRIVATKHDERQEKQDLRPPSG
jgi:hypothetical protein